MNAPTTDPGIAILRAPLTAIALSMTGVQQLRRKHFNQTKLDELAASLKAIGQLQPVVVRPLPIGRDDGPASYELVAGERRVLAAIKAGFEAIDATVRDLTDDQVLEAQLVENLQREDVHPLEEAEGYHELMRLKDLTADQVGALVGKSRSWVYARLKLRALSAEGREALASGRLDASRALLVAQVANPKLQKKALALATETIYDGSPLHSYRRLQEKIRDGFTENLADAVFPLDEDRMPIGKGKAARTAPACTACPHRIVEDGAADACGEPACYAQKTAVYWARKRADAEAAGRTILTGDDARAAIPTPSWQSDQLVTGDWVLLDSPCSDVAFSEPEPEDDDGPEWRAWNQRENAYTPPTFRTLLDGLPVDTVLAEHPDGSLAELAPTKAVKALLKAKGIKLTVPREERSADDDEAARQDPAERMAAEAKWRREEAIELEYRKRLLTATWAKWKGPLKRPDLLQIADCVCDYDLPAAVSDLLEGPDDEPVDAKAISKLKDDELVRLIVFAAIGGEAERTHGKPASLLALAQRFRIDPKKIRAEAKAAVGKQEPAA
jgi:ParB/RepB/Spo0J family partition protein